MTNKQITNGNNTRKVLISKYSKHWEVTPFIMHSFLNDWVLFGGCENPVIYTVYTVKDLNSLVNNYLNNGIIYIGNNPVKTTI